VTNSILQEVPKEPSRPQLTRFTCDRGLRQKSTPPSTHATLTGYPREHEGSLADLPEAETRTVNRDAMERTTAQKKSVLIQTASAKHKHEETTFKTRRNGGRKKTSSAHARCDYNDVYCCGKKNSAVRMRVVIIMKCTVVGKKTQQCACVLRL